MKEDEIMQMAIQAGNTVNREWLKRFAKQVAEYEREACAKVCDDLWEDDGTAYECAEAVRARGQK